MGDWLAWVTWKVLLTWENVDSDVHRFRIEEHSQGEDYRLVSRVRVDTSATAAVGQAGGVLLIRTVEVTGLDRAPVSRVGRVA